MKGDDSLGIVSARVQVVRRRGRLDIGDSLVGAILRGNGCGSWRVATAVRCRVWDMSGVEDIDDAHGHSASGTHQPVGG